MRIRFKQDVELQIVTEMDGDTPITENETFKAGEETEIDVCDEEKHEIQFGNGSCAYVMDDFWTMVEIVQDAEVVS